MIPGAPKNKHGSASTSTHLFILDNTKAFEYVNSKSYFANIISAQRPKTLIKTRDPFLYIIVKSDIGSDLGKFRRDFRDYKLKQGLDLPFRMRSPMYTFWTGRLGSWNTFPSVDIATLNPNAASFNAARRTVGELNLTAQSLYDIFGSTAYGDVKSGKDYYPTFYIDGFVNNVQLNLDPTCMIFPDPTIHLDAGAHCTTLAVHEYATYTDIFISYVMRVTLYGKQGMWALSQHQGIIAVKDFNNTSFSMGQYSAPLVYQTYNVPMIAKYRYTGSGQLSLLGVVNPTMDVSRKFDISTPDSVGCNNKVIPEKQVSDTLLNFTTSGFSGAWSTPANNYCTSLMIKDAGYYGAGHRLLNIVGYDPNTIIDPSFSIRNSMLYISAINTASVSTFTTSNQPTFGPLAINMTVLIRAYDPTLKTNNIAKISAVRWNNIYVIAVTYGQVIQDKASYFTVLLSLDATTELNSSPVYSIIKIIDGAAYTDLTVVS